MSRSRSSSQGDDSLQHLTAEEKACLLFLEETIDSLDTAEHNGLSHDKSATANLTKGKELGYCDDPRNSASKDRKRNYLVPTPFILANGKPGIPAKPGTASSSGKPLPGKDKASKNEKLPQNNPAIAEEVNVTEIPPRPPRSSEHLVELRKNLSMRTSVEFEKQPSTLESSVSENEGETQTTSESKPSRPAVPPKPKIIPSHIAGLSQKGTSSPNADSCLSTSPRNKSNCGIEAPSAPRVLKKQPVASDFSILTDQNTGEDRREALRKLGLLKN